MFFNFFGTGNLSEVMWGDIEMAVSSRDKQKTDLHFTICLYDSIFNGLVISDDIFEASKAWFVSKFASVIAALFIDITSLFCWRNLG